LGRPNTRPARILERDIEDAGGLAEARARRPLLAALWLWIADSQIPASRAS
jgi:hypothetical protein